MINVVMIVHNSNHTSNSITILVVIVDAAVMFEVLPSPQLTAGVDTYNVCTPNLPTNITPTNIA